MKIIPREKRKHFGWSPEQQAPQRPSPAPALINPASATQHIFNLEDLIERGKPFYSEKKNADGMYIGVADSLEQAQNYAGSQGVIASMPYLIAGKSIADEENYLWQSWFAALSEENIGIDKDGRFTEAGKPVIITVHGGGILTYDRIIQAYSEGLTPQNAAKLKEDEFNNLLNGVLPDDENIDIYAIDDVTNRKLPHFFGRYAVALDFETAKATSSGYYKKSEFMKNPLVLARAGTINYLDDYFDKAKSSENKLGNWHRLNEIDYRQPQGRVLFVNYNQDGLGGYDLSGGGRFVGVAPEAPGVVAKK